MPCLRLRIPTNLPDQSRQTAYCAAPKAAQLASSNRPLRPRREEFRRVWKSYQNRRGSRTPACNMPILRKLQFRSPILLPLRLPLYEQPLGASEQTPDENGILPRRTMEVSQNNSIINVPILFVQKSFSWSFREQNYLRIFIRITVRDYRGFHVKSLISNHYILSYINFPCHG